MLGIINKPLKVKAADTCSCVSVSVTTDDGCHYLGCYSNQGAQNVMNSYPTGTHFNIARIRCPTSNNVSGLQIVIR